MCYKHPSSKNQEMMYSIEKIAWRLILYNVGHLEPFIPIKTGKKYLLVDGFTKYLVMGLVKDTTKNVVRLLVDVFIYLERPSLLRHLLCSVKTMILSAYYNDFKC